jgi:hypothetical protein
MRRFHGRPLLFAQIKLKDGRWLIRSLDTASESVAAARMVPLLIKLIGAGEIGSRARVCRLYLPGRCSRCGRPVPGAK